MLIETKRRGGRVVELPATLESRLLGESKMKIVRTIGGHLGLLRQLTLARAKNIRVARMHARRWERRRCRPERRPRSRQKQNQGAARARTGVTS